MKWNWQRAEWPRFAYDAGALESLERTFLLRSGELAGTFRHVGADDQLALRIELIGDEALKTSEIEGEILDRDSVQSSLRRQFGVSPEALKVPARERGIAEMMVSLFRTFDAPLSHTVLFDWHRMVMAGHGRLDSIGAYRTHRDSMQIVSGRVGKERIHFEAPPSEQVGREMEAFVAWFNDTMPTGARPLPALVRAGIAHIYFESIHPFEDGNGRIGRALSEKALAQGLGRPTLIALAYTIERGRKTYYETLELNNKTISISTWLDYFARTVLEAQETSIRRVAFHIDKARYYDRLGGLLSTRQQKVLARMFREGIGGFTGGLSADNYISITKTSRATATRDLRDLVAKGALKRTGERRYARYHLNLP